MPWWEKWICRTRHTNENFGGRWNAEELHLWTCIACSSFNKFHDGGAGQIVNAFLCFFDLSKVCLNFESGWLLCHCMYDWEVDPPPIPAFTTHYPRDFLARRWVGSNPLRAPLATILSQDSRMFSVLGWKIYIWQCKENCITESLPPCSYAYTPFDPPPFERQNLWMGWKALLQYTMR